MSTRIPKSTKFPPDIERFFQELKKAKESASIPPPQEPPPAPKPMQIVVLPEPDGDIIARIDRYGDFQLTSSGEVRFRYLNEPAHRWYVNRNMSAFLEAVRVFNKCGEDVCRLLAEDEDAEPEAPWALARLRTEFEKIEPLGDPKTCLWSATVQDADGGLLRLY